MIPPPWYSTMVRYPQQKGIWWDPRIPQQKGIWDPNYPIATDQTFPAIWSRAHFYGFTRKELCALERDVCMERDATKETSKRAAVGGWEATTGLEEEVRGGRRQQWQWLESTTLLRLQEWGASFCGQDFHVLSRQ